MSNLTHTDLAKTYIESTRAVVAAVASLSAKLATEIAAPSFTGLDWDIYDAAGDAIDSGPVLDAIEAGVEADAAEALEGAKVALGCLADGDIDGAAHAIEVLVACEYQHGDAPSWGFALDGADAVRAALEGVSTAAQGWYDCR